MDNIQLYRTNILLGGQVKWDLVLDIPNISNITDDDIKEINQLNVMEFNITPVCKNVSLYNKKFNDNIINTSHQDNLKKYYSYMGSSFYDDFVSSELESLSPILNSIDSSKYKDTHISVYEMGCRRAEYSKYNKQFEFFCPIWIEHLAEDEYLQFEITSGINNTKHIAKKVIPISVTKYSDEYHNKFVKYFNEYVKFTKIKSNDGNDNIMVINADKNEAQVTGLSVQSGLMSNVKIPYIVHDLIDREIPLLEFDSIITNQLKNNKLVVPQLFNFSFFFNPEDIFMKSVLDAIYGQSMDFNITVKIINGDEERILESKDFYSNFEYIPKKLIGPINVIDYNMAPNVLDYLEDYKYINNIDKNKMTQSIIHWSLTNNNDYIFNVYNGFAGYALNDNGEITLPSHIYDDTPDVNASLYDLHTNTIGWCNHVRLNNNINLYSINPPHFFNNIRIYSEMSSDFSSDVEWINKIKYDKDSTDYKLHVMLIVNDSNVLMEEYLNRFKYPYIKYGTHINNEGIFLFKDKNSDLLFISFTYKNFGGLNDNTLRHYTSFLKMKNVLNDIYEGDEDIIRLKNLLVRKMNCVQNSNNPPTIMLYKTVIPQLTKGPKTNTSEITYYNGNTVQYVLRHFGKIKPTFINGINDINFNYLYYKDVISDKNYNESMYYKYGKSNYKPLYPSINYFPYKKVEQKYSLADQSKICKNGEMHNLRSEYEYRWFNDSNYIILKNNLIVAFTTDELTPLNYNEISESDKQQYIKNYIKKYLGSIYKITDESLLEYIYNRYKTDKYYDYASPTDITNYTYNIKLILK